MSAEELKGAALDDALDEAGLSKTGTADEKRARLAEHQADDVTVGDAVGDAGGVESTSGEQGPARVGRVWVVPSEEPLEIHRPDRRVVTAYPTGGRVTHVLDVPGEYRAGEHTLTVKG